ncbi:hypothetical protein [Amycolatopsis minnesotensis]
MSYQVDRVIEELDAALRLLKDTMRGIPARRQGFVAIHDRMAKSMAELTVNLSDARSVVES